MKTIIKQFVFFIAFLAFGIGIRTTYSNYKVSCADEFLRVDVVALSQSETPKKNWDLWVHECEITKKSSSSTTTTQNGNVEVGASAGASASAAGKKVEGKVSGKAGTSNSKSTTDSNSKKTTQKGEVGSCKYNKEKGEYYSCKDVPTFECQ